MNEQAELALDRHIEHIKQLEEELNYSYMERSNLNDMIDDLKNEMEWVGAINNALLPYQERAVKAERQLAEIERESDEWYELAKQLSTELYEKCLDKQTEKE